MNLEVLFIGAVRLIILMQIVLYIITYMLVKRRENVPIYRDKTSIERSKKSFDRGIKGFNYIFLFFFVYLLLYLIVRLFYFSSFTSPLEFGWTWSFNLHILLIIIIEREYFKLRRRNVEKL
jgi:TRAP-type C4-dicarboxylate transport system permease large subunit